MSQHPRLAGDGLLNLPAKVAFGHDGFIYGRFSETNVDPFDWTADRLLLAESFARLDLEDRRAVKSWMVAHGAVNAVDFTGGDAEVPDDWLERRRSNAFAESRQEDTQEQANVRWLLATLVRLSETRDTRKWDPSWGEIVVDGGSTYLIGGDASGTEVWPAHRFELVDRFPQGREMWGDPEPQRALLPEVARRPRLHLRMSSWYGYWVGDYVDGQDSGLLPGLERLGSTWDQALDLVRLIIEPYVARAVERSFRIEWRRQDDDQPSPLMPREWRLWTSALGPIYLQLFESLRRISENEPGAAICRECGQPFLVLDGRRRFFCNDRERFRYSQRERRKRLSGSSDGADGAEEVASIASPPDAPNR